MFVVQLDQFISETLTAALHSDSLRSSHPISVDVKDPAEINEIFDQISYEKVSTFLYMYSIPWSQCVYDTSVFDENFSLYITECNIFFRNETLQM